MEWEVALQGHSIPKEKEEEAGEGCPVDRTGALLAPGTSIPSASLPVAWRRGKSGAYTCCPPPREPVLGSRLA